MSYGKDDVIVTMHLLLEIENGEKKNIDSSLKRKKHGK